MNIESVLNCFSMNKNLNNVSLDNLKIQIEGDIENILLKNYYQPIENNNKVMQDKYVSEELSTFRPNDSAQNSYSQPSTCYRSIKDLILNRHRKKSKYPGFNDQSRNYSSENYIDNINKKEKSIKIGVSKLKQQNVNFPAYDTVCKLRSNYSESSKRSELSSYGFDKDLCITNNLSNSPFKKTEEKLLENNKTFQNSLINQEIYSKPNPNDEDSKFKSELKNEMKNCIDFSTNIKIKTDSLSSQNKPDVYRSLKKEEIDELTIRGMINTNFNKTQNEIIEDDSFKQWQNAQKHSFHEFRKSNESTDDCFCSDNQQKVINTIVKKEVSTSNINSLIAKNEKYTLIDILEGKYNIPNSLRTKEILGVVKNLDARNSRGFNTSCRSCNFVGNSKQEIDSHFERMHQTYSCVVCNFSTKSQVELNSHLSEKHASKLSSFNRYDINGNEGSLNRIDLNGVTQHAHDNKNIKKYFAGHINKTKKTRKYTCKQCSFSTSLQKEIWTHTKTHVPASKLLSCPHCPFVCAFKHHMQYHLNNHFGFKPFRCQLCTYRCNNKSMLNSHLKSHSGEYPFKCKKCNYVSKYKQALYIHGIKMNHSTDDNDLYKKDRHSKGDFGEHRNRFKMGSNRNEEVGDKELQEQRIFSELFSKNYEKSLIENMSLSVSSILQNNMNLPKKKIEEEYFHNHQSMDNLFNNRQHPINSFKSLQPLPDLIFPYVMPQPISLPNNLLPNLKFQKSNYLNMSSFVKNENLFIDKESQNKNSKNLSESEQQTFCFSDQNVPIDLSLRSKNTLN